VSNKGKTMKNIMFAAGICLAAGPVMAQGLAPLQGSPEAAPSTWDGYYLGLAVSSGDVSLSNATATEEYSTQGFGLQFGVLRDVGTFVVGGEFAYVSADIDDVPGFSGVSLNSARLKAIGGVEAGQFLPYGFVGLSNVEFSFDTIAGELAGNETGFNYGIGGRVALGAEGRVIAGLEYLVEEVDDFGGSGVDVENNDLSLRLDYKY
jgi:outer membrane immunogenic protein